ncbi:MAG: LytTR family transcriptional regulator [Ruminococcus sp.]|nr:LytTR family transcriptional regulator [Ruminococcus sp.]
MNINTISKLTYYIVSEYYKNNLEPFFEYLDDNILWFGPAEKQILKSKQSMLDAWSREQNDLTFTIGDVVEYKVPLTKTCCNIIVSFPIFTHYPDGVTHLHNQRIDCLWTEYKTKDDHGNITTTPRILKMHISNTVRMNDEDFVYAVHSENNNIGQLNFSQSEHVTFRGKNNTIYHCISDSILWIEKANEGRNSLVYTLTGEIESSEKTLYFLEKYPELFLSPHVSYLVNPLHIKSINRFQITLDNNTVLSVPEKKYTKFKSSFSEWIETQNKKQSE